MTGCPSSHQPTRIREETLESGGPLQRKFNFPFRTSRCNKNNNLGCCIPDVLKFVFKIYRTNLQTHPVVVLLRVRTERIAPFHELLPPRLFSIHAQSTCCKVKSRCSPQTIIIILAIIWTFIPRLFTGWTAASQTAQGRQDWSWLVTFRESSVHVDSERMFLLKLFMEACWRHPPTGCF